jgi:MoaA/NifB/PqqE/SkfB family radical SAM enzyme
MLSKKFWKEYSSIAKRALALLSRNRNPQYLILFVTARCHSKCPFCFYWKNQSQAELIKELSLSEIQKISSNLCRFEYLCLTGGEPFLRQDFVALCRTFIEQNKVKFISIPTSALLPQKMEKDLDSILSASPHVRLRMTLSFNGIGDDFDSMHGISGVFNKFLESIDRLKKLKSIYPNLDLQVNTVYSFFTEKKLDEIYRFVKEKINPDNYVVAVLRGTPRNQDAMWTSLSGYQRIMNEIERDVAKTFSYNSNPIQKIFQVLHIRSREIVLKALLDKHMPIKCTAGKKLIVIGETGKVFACELLGSEMGDLRKSDYNIKEILYSPAAVKLRSFIKNKGCYCTWECAILNSLVFEPSTYPESLRLMRQLSSQHKM